MMASRLALLPLPLLVASCGPAAGSAPAALAPASVAIPPAPLEAPAHAADARAADAPAVDPSAPLTLPIAALPPATWVEPPLGEQERARAAQDPFLQYREIALGERVAILNAKGAGADAKGAGADPAGGAFAVDEKLGVVGPLKLPARFTWVGVAGPQIDAVYAATPDGALHRAAGVHDALRADGFEPRGSVPGATAWDAAGPLIAAAAGERVSVSADEGRSFTPSVVAPGKAVRAVLVRPDGVLAAVVEAQARGQRAAAPDTFLSLDRGRSWRRSAFQPRSIRRTGSWIWNGDSMCPAVLSRDGQAWTRTAALNDLYARPTLETALRLSSAIRATAAGSFRSAVAPPAPEPPPRGGAAVGREPPCQPDGEGVVGGVMGGLLGTPGVSCEGASCLLEGAMPRRPPTRTQIATFGDGICDPATARPPGSACAKHLTRPPTLAVVDHIASTVTPIAAPEGCPQPVRLHDVTGIGVLICRGGSGGAALFVRGAQGPWHAEGSQATPAEALTWIAAAPDGTLLLLEPTPPASAPQREPLQALVRSPLPLGAPQAWRRVTAPDGVAALPAPGGAALLASSPAASAGRRLDVTLYRPGQPALPLAHDVEVHQDLTLMEVRNGQVRFRVRPKPGPEVQGRPSPPPPQPRDERWHVLTRGGELVLETPSGPTPPAEQRWYGPAGR